MTPRLAPLECETNDRGTENAKLKNTENVTENKNMRVSLISLILSALCLFFSMFSVPLWFVVRHSRQFHFGWRHDELVLSLRWRREFQLFNAPAVMLERAAEG